MGEFQDQLEASDRDNVNKLIGELREICAKGAAGDADVTPEQIKTCYDAAQQASLVLFQKAYEKRSAANASASESSEASSEKTDSTPEGEKKN